MHTHSTHVCVFPPMGFFSSHTHTHRREREKWPLITAKWIVPCDGHIGRPQEKIPCDTYNVILLFRNGWQVFPVCWPAIPPFLSSTHPSIHPRPLPPESSPEETQGADMIRRWEIDRREREEERDEGGVKKMPVCIALSKEMPRSLQISCLIRSQRGEREVKRLHWQRNRLWQREMQTQGGLG